MDTPADTTTAAPVIEMNGVTVNSLVDPDRMTLEDVNWKVSAGNFWVIAGMQGSGKTDLLSATAGLMPPQNGSYRLFGCDMPIYDQELQRERLRLGLVFDNGQLLHQLNVRENIALPLRYHRQLPWEDIEAQVKAMLDLTELSSLSHVRCSSLSRDAQKRAGLARALMLQPEVLLVDDPLSGLDLRQANWWSNLLAQLSAGHGLFGGRRITLVVTTQDLRPWRNLNCHFAVLKKQRFIALGQCSELAGHTEPLVKELLAETPTTT